MRSVKAKRHTRSSLLLPLLAGGAAPTTLWAADGGSVSSLDPLSLGEATAGFLLFGTILVYLAHRVHRRLQSLYGALGRTAATLEITALRCREAEALLRLAQGATGAGTWRWDVESNVVHLDEQFRRLTGFAGETAGNGWQGFLQHVHPSDRSTFTRPSPGTP